MTNAFDTAFAAASDHLADAFGEVVAYTAPTAGATASNVSVEEFSELNPELSNGDMSQSESQNARCVVYKSELASPARGGKFERNSVTWCVETFHAIDNNAKWSIELKRTKTTTLGAASNRTNPRR